ncbi:hypothetical protein MAM1_0086c04756 [Mucor ambiguus]|uniref:Tc1-like transposase DDE domain-containing protein n=1 Tax=Mucor ambiguus TaxID=91626 RepID=A0A0C9M6A3_9FUNG|nr:hypothetical protein MAM1_0086c04756 [Mucor ambiguus]
MYFTSSSISLRLIRTVNQRNLEMDYATNCVFVDEAGFNMHLRRNFGRSIKGNPAKQVVPSSRGVSISIIGAICELGVIDLTLRKPTPITKKSTKGKKKRKRNDDSAEEAVEAVEAVEEVNGRVGTSYSLSRVPRCRLDIPGSEWHDRQIHRDGQRNHTQDGRNSKLHPRKRIQSSIPTPIFPVPQSYRGILG